MMLVLRRAVMKLLARTPSILVFLGLSSIVCITWQVTTGWKIQSKTITFITRFNREKTDVITPRRDAFPLREVSDGSKKVILLSYMRAGTTFVGSTFDKNKDIFYVFEPVWSLIFESLNEYKPLKYVDGSVREPVWIDEARSLIRTQIENYFHCNISGIDVESLKQRFMREGQYTKPFHACVHSKNKTLPECVDELTKTCKSKAIRVLKTVRLRAYMIEDLLRSDPTVRIIHLIRDPRGIAVSRMGWAEVYSAKHTFTFGRVCAEILRDIELMESLPPDVSKRVLPVLYEEVAENPEIMVQNLYNFLDIPLQNYIREYVKNTTHAAHDVRNGLSTRRANSFKTAYSWRTKIDWNLSNNMDSICGRVYKKVGYLPAKSNEDLRNFSVPLLIQHFTASYLDSFRQKRQTN